MNPESTRNSGCVGPGDARFRAIFQSAAVGIALVEITGRPVQCNPALERILGYTESELRRMTFPEFTHPDDLEAELELYHRLVFGERDHYEIEKRYIRKDRQVVWVHLTISLVQGEGASSQFVVALVQDITDHKKALESLQESEEKFSKAFYGNPEPTLITRKSDGRIVEANQAFCDLFRISSERAREMTAFDLGIWKTQEERESFLRRLDTESVIRNYEMSVEMPSGQKRATVLTVQPVTIRQEDCLVTIATDMTEQKRTERALQQSEEHLHLGLEAAKMGIWELDVDSGQLVWSRGVHALFGLQPGKFGGTLQSFFELLEPGDRERARLEIEEALRSRTSKYYSEVRVRWPDGSMHWLEGRGDVLRDETGRPRKFLGTAVDITERKLAELVLGEAQRRELLAREELTRQLINAEEQERQRLAFELHDGLGQNLSIIKNNAFLALANHALPDTATTQLRTISETTAAAIEEIRSLVRNLRPLQIEQLGLSDSIRELVEKVARSTPIRLDSRIEDVDDSVKGAAATHLYRIVQESLNNLVKHSGADKALLRLERDIDCIRVRVSDNGSGFEPGKVPSRGGLGLKSIEERARMLGGTLRIQSAPGGGTELVVQLPLAEKVT